MSRFVSESATIWLSLNWPMASVTAFAFVLSTITSTPCLSSGESGLIFSFVPGSTASGSKSLNPLPALISLKKRSTARSS